MHKQQQHETPAQGKPVLAFSHVSKSFGDKTAVQDMELSVRRGEIFGFLGPNGAGKTTTIKLLLDILRPTTGTIELFGMSSRLTAATHRRLGYLSGDMVLDDDLTGRQYLAFLGNLYGGNYVARQKELAGLLQADLDVKIGNYSRGNKQKIGLIAALMHQPELLILDEPSSGFDPLMQEVFIKLVQEYRAAGGTVFISSHTLGEVQRLCDRVAFIRDGRLISVVDVDDLNKNTAKQVHIVAAHAQIEALKLKAGTLPGLVLQEAAATRVTLSYSGPVRPLLTFCAGFDLGDLTIREPDLEEIFMTYYAADKSEAASAPKKAAPK